MKPPQSSQREIGLVIQLGAAISIASFFYYLRRGELLLYGDAVAHINIARRVFDSRAPGPLQLGTVWLPLPHILLLPFVAPLRWWQSGIGGAIPSMVAFAANPNLLYLQATAMTEALFLALLVWATYFLLVFSVRLREGDERAGRALV